MHETNCQRLEKMWQSFLLLIHKNIPWQSLRLVCIEGPSSWAAGFGRGLSSQELVDNNWITKNVGQDHMSYTCFIQYINHGLGNGSSSAGGPLLRLVINR